MLALRPDFISPVFCDELYKLLDQVPPFESRLAMDILKRELGSNFPKLLELEPVPTASASFAQVHRAKLNNGDIVAVKIQRPDIELLVRSDLGIMKFLARLFDFWFRPTNKLINIVEEFEIWTKDELDYSLEATNIERFNRVASLVGDGIRGPKVYKNLSTPKVLTMEFIDGYSLTQIITLLREGKKKQVRELGFDGKDVVDKLIKNMLEMAHIHGFFHADPHPANIILTPEKELVLIDFGIVGSLTKKERVLILRYFRTLLSGNAKDSFDSLLELCGNKQPDNIDQIKEKYRILVDKFVATFHSKTYLEQQIKSGPILVGTLSLMQSNDMKLPINIVRYFKMFETIEGLIFALYPELQIQDMLKEFRRVSIINIVDSIPTEFDEKKINLFVLKLIDSIEKSLILSDL
ncbi:MAG: AarF/ABC1/UbiB kinase family protein [Candidatus Roizmanbacteria bacterium]|nr:AarF/ABC1/UbiB kinase family protein [Candidatus Roizmanbacteria bacterium]